jgi:cell division septation protein DedD
MSEALGQIDPNVRIPPSVLAASRAADELHKTTYAPPEPIAPVEEVTPQSNEPAPVAQAEAPPAPEPKQERKPDESSWEHRYHSMKGRFDRATEENRALAESLRSMQIQLGQLQAEVERTRNAPAHTEDESLITQEEMDAYGSDFMDVVAKRAREAVSSELREARQQINDLKAQLGNVGGYVATNEKARMLSTLDSQLPRWREINEDKNFLTWLQLPDAYSGAIRHQLLKAAYEQHNAPRVLAFFNGFLAEEAVVDPANRGPAQTDTSVQKVPLETLAAPGRAKTAAASGAPAEKPSFTTAQISRFYADVASGKYLGREAEQSRIEAQIFDAQREGRIR